MFFFPSNYKISGIDAYEILDSRGNPTVEARVFLRGGIYAAASVPSGASTGVHEALELRDKTKRYNGKGVQKAVRNILNKIAPALIGADVTNQHAIDALLLDLDGTSNKSKLGANAILAVSLACARAASLYAEIPLYRHIAFLADRRELSLPTPSFNILNGGQHADNSVDVQEFMVMPAGVKGFAQQVQAGAEIFHALKGILASKEYVTAVGDEGGFAPNLKSNVEALELIKEAVAQTKWKWGKNIFIALDPAASEFYEKGKYVLRGDGRKKSLSAQKMIDYWADWVKNYPIISIEDPLDQDDHKAWVTMTEQLGNDIQIVGDDFLVTNPERIEQAIIDGACNALLVKYNQIGTLSEAIKAVQLAQAAGWKVMVSHRSGETTDTFLADFAVGVGADQIKTGSLSRGERLCKYNRLMEIERELHSNELDA